MADEAIRWWVGVPSHAHAVAAGFHAAAGDPAAVALGDTDLCEQVLADLVDIADSCAVNGAVVCFMGSNAHRAGILAAALGRYQQARSFLQSALEIHERIGARAWEAESCMELALLAGFPEAQTYRSRALRIAAARPSTGPVRDSCLGQPAFVVAGLQQSWPVLVHSGQGTRLAADASPARDRR